jgi:hypothetical protein
MWVSKHIVTGEKIQELADIYIGEPEDFAYNPRIQQQTSKHMNVSEIPKVYDNPAIVFVYSHCVAKLSNHISSFRNPFTLLSHNSDGNITYCQDVWSILSCPHLVKWFAQNACVSHEKLVPLPIGLANSMWPHGNLNWFTHTAVSKPNNVYFNFNITTNERKRLDCYAALKDRLPFLPKVPADENITRLRSYKFCICPEGNGVDTHRFWEALYVQTIPIVLDSPFVRLLKERTRIPMIVLNSWSELDVSKLEYRIEDHHLSDLSFEAYRRRILGTAPVTFVLTCLVNFQEYILDSVRNLIVNGNRRIVVITEPQYLSRFAEFPAITLIDKNSLSDEFGFEAKSNLDRTFRDGFWHLASARLFVLYAYLKAFHVNRCVHIENDVMVYANADTIHWHPDRMSSVYDCPGRVIPSVLWIPTPETLHRVLCGYDTVQNDMTNLGKADLERLPIFPDNWTLGSSPYDAATTAITETFPEYSYIFDAAAIGQFLGGVDPRNQPGDTRGFVNETCLIKYNHFSFVWKHGRPFLNISGHLFPIFNLHIHSKNLKMFKTHPRAKILALVLSSCDAPYDEFLRNWKLYDVPQGVKILYYMFNPAVKEIELRGNELHIPGVESLVPGTYLKTIAAIKYALEREEFDYLLRPNLSSAFRFDELLEWFGSKPKERYAFGPWMFGLFLSGCGFAMTPDVAERFVKWHSPTRSITLDDMMFKQFKEETGIPHIEWTLDGCYGPPNYSAKDVFHFRFTTNRDDRRSDIMHHRAAIEYFNTVTKTRLSSPDTPNTSPLTDSEAQPV